MKKVKTDHSRIPLPNLIQEGSNKQYICRDDKDALISWGLEENSIKLLPTLTRACIDAETALQICLKMGKVVSARWIESIAAGRTNRACLAAMVRKIPLFKNSGFVLPQYCDRKKQVDIIEDLYELYTLCCKLISADPGAIPDRTFMDKALELHIQLRSLRVELAVLKNKKTLCTKTKANAARALKTVIDKINNAGQNVFFDNPEKRARYKYGFYVEQNRKRKNRKKREI
ncbi:MAG TPA: hypothetical protein VHO70_17730 [Chitinispirillaceae bacterium]|nr:hypothetical protein [Chitinispirillaceae bacterium]